MRFFLPLLTSACALLLMVSHAHGEEVRDITGKDHAAAIKQAKAVVYIYTDTTCPIANFYQPTLRRLAKNTNHRRSSSSRSTPTPTVPSPN